MKVLVTGGTGVIGRATVAALADQGHSIRVLSRGAHGDVSSAVESGQDGNRVEFWPASITDSAGLRGCAEGCDLAVHVAGIMEESPPDLTYETVNVEGTRLIVREAERCKVGRFIFVSSLGAEAGTSPYHRSKRRAEEIVRAFDGGWIILRPGNVYGPGDDVISLVLTMVRSLPVMPVLGSGEDAFQPIWVGDLVAAITEAVRRTDLHGRVLELAGEDTINSNELIDRLSAITDRSPVRVPIPSFLIQAGITMAGILGVKLPVTESQLTMLSEGNVISTPGANALTGVFHIKPIPLDSGLRRLADTMPEQTPDEGVGALKRHRFWVDIAGTPLSPEELFARFRVRFAELTPFTMNVRAEPGTPTMLELGTTITMALPVRGNVQVRVERLTTTEADLVTVAGHPLAGAIRFLAQRNGDLVRFQIQLYDRPANLADWLLMRTVGEGVQARTWENLLEAVVAESGGTHASPIQSEEESLDEIKSERIEAWVKELIAERVRGSELRSDVEVDEVKPRRSAVDRSAENEGEEAFL